MASALPSFPSTKETTNYARLCRLLVDVGSQALRDTFDGVHPPAGLHGVLARHPEHTTLQSLYTGRRRVINPTQWGKLYPTIPSSVSSAGFDITLLMILLRNICGLHPPPTGWDNLPPPADTSKEANIARVKYYRNTVYGHASQASVDDATFNTNWQDISTALVALGGAGYVAAINKLKNECMDPDTEEHYRELLKQWKKDEDCIKDKLIEIEGNIRDDIEQLNEKLNTFMAQRDGSSSKNKDETRDDLKQMKSEIQNISEKLNRQMLQREETTDEVKIRKDIEQLSEKLDTFMAQREGSSTKDKDAFDPAELIDGIRQLYKLREGWLAPFPWCEEFHFHLDNIYTRLEVISRQKERGTATDNTVDMSEIFKPHEECPQPRTILIEGTPGMGKTTYCQKFVYDWATGKQKAEDAFPMFEIVLLLRCRDMKSADLWEAIDDQLLPLDIKEDVREKFFDYIRQNQSNVLLILDGLDEVASTKLPMFSEILQGRVLPKCCFVATARHEAGMKVRKYCDTLLQIEGFTAVDTEHFIDKYFKTNEDLAEKLLDKLYDDEKLETMVRNPLNTALLCLFCEDCQGKFPENRGKLFQEVVQCILRRYRKKEGLPETEDDLLKVYKAQLEHLGWIAFEGLRKNSLDFEGSKLANRSGDIPKFGFLSVHFGGSKLRPCPRYSFLHKSFQEWFAAFYLCCQLVEGKISPDKLLNKLHVDIDERDDYSDEEDDEYCSHKEDFLEVLCFAVNMLAARCEELAVDLINSMAALIEDHSVSSWGFLATCCIKEFQRDNSSLFIKLAHAFGSGLKCQILDLDLDLDCDDDDIAVVAEAFKVNTTVNSINVSGQINAVAASCLANALKHNSSLTRLVLGPHIIGGFGCAYLADALQVNSTLTELSLSLNRIDAQGTASFGKALKVNKTLAKLDLDSCRIGANGVDLADALKVNATLRELILPWNDLGDQCGAPFAEALRVNKTLTKLDLSSCHIGEDGGADLTDALKVNTALTELTLSFNKIGDKGAARLSTALRVNKTLTKLDLSSCHIGEDGGADLTDALKVNTALTELSLSSNRIGDQGAARFAEALRVNKTLTKLDLRSCHIGENGCFDLADALKVNTTLTELSLSINGIAELCAPRFAEALRGNKTLTKLNLSFCDIGEDSWADLADALKVNTTMTELKLYNNCIRDRGATRLAEALRVNKTLTKLDLAKNGIGNSGTICLADALKTNTGLTELNLSYNNIDMDGCASLVDALQHNTTLAKLYLFPLPDRFLYPADFDDPRDKAVVTELRRLKRDGRVVYC